jgi:hypothetical protein
MKYPVAFLIIFLIWNCKQTDKTAGAVVAGNTEILTDAAQGTYFRPGIDHSGEAIYVTGRSDRGLWKIETSTGMITQLNGIRGAGSMVTQGGAGGPLYFRVDTAGADHRRRFGVVEQNPVDMHLKYLITPGYREISDLQMPENNRLVFWNGSDFEGIDLKNGHPLTQAEIGTGVYTFSDSSVLYLNEGRKEFWHGFGKNRITGLKEYRSAAKILISVAPRGFYISGEDGKILDHCTEGFQADWCPENNLVAWVEQDDNGMQISASRIVIGSMRGETKIRLSEPGGENPCWQPDGKALYYNTLDGRIVRTEIRTEH